MRYPWTSKFYARNIRSTGDTNATLYRYEIAEGAPGWADAEKQVLNAAKKGQKSVVVSVKTAKPKRKAGESAAEIYAEEMGEKQHKKAKKGSKKEERS